MIEVFSLRMVLKESKHVGILRFNSKIIYFNTVHFWLTYQKRHLMHGYEHKMYVRTYACTEVRTLVFIYH